MPLRQRRMQKYEGLFVYYESIKRKLNNRLILECRCDARLKVKDEGSTRLTHTGWCGKQRRKGHGGFVRRGKFIFSRIKKDEDQGKENVTLNL